MTRYVSAAALLLVALMGDVSAATATMVKCPAGNCGSGPVLDVRAQPSNSPIAVVVAIALIGPDGPIWTTAGYATTNGWRVASIPEPLYYGPAPNGWRATIPMRGGICALVTTANAPSGQYGLYVSSAVVDDSAERDARASIEELKASGNPELMAHAIQAERDLAAARSSHMWMQSLDALRAGLVRVSTERCLATSPTNGR